eukprot:TRINITY_DN3962_c0_g2_i1.p1 TRINITY_DN3962_c0_g2~~TRINITY_DN3962_c0_g2_i1.p1  ORF type:complete len:328 (+),score=65.77 TRINITY_DN3962_c0_g2_i1:17-1000(+)
MGNTPVSKTQNSKHIVFIGDSTLDNVVWVNGQKETVTAQLGALLPDYKITNYAADGFTTQNALLGRYPGISIKAREASGDPFPPLPDGKFKPLDQLRTLHAAHPVSHIVLSVGGNDIREILGNMSHLPQRVSDFNKNYPKILQKLRDVTPNVLIMLQYRPSILQDSFYGVYRSMASLGRATVTSGMMEEVVRGVPEERVALLEEQGLLAGVPVINALMEEIYPLVFQLASVHNLPVIDLPNSIDIFDPSLFKSQIEPSREMGILIASLIKNAIECGSLGSGNGETVLFHLLENGQPKTRTIPYSEWSIGTNTNKTINTYLKSLISAI